MKTMFQSSDPNEETISCHSNKLQSGKPTFFLITWSFTRKALLSAFLPREYDEDAGHSFSPFILPIMPGRC
ncbi:hypothetical protein Mapa_015118 [Marchantia paleacea]|nr:hypothetical protein Mapa_015118 [Marchantia paleacea]